MSAWIGVVVLAIALCVTLRIIHNMKQRMNAMSDYLRVNRVGVEKLALLFQNKIGTPSEGEMFIVDLQRESMGLQGQDAP